MCAANASSSLGVDVSLERPTLLFERYTAKGHHKRQRYYACSACRDRKDCNFFQSADEKVSEARSKVREEYNRAQQPWKSHEDFYQRMEATNDLSPQKRRFCQDCSLLLRLSEAGEHAEHTVRSGLSDDALRQPSHLLVPLENSKTNAQYLFSTKSTEFLMSTVKKLGFNRVLCVGVPRLHEAIQAKRSCGLSSLLLDIDHRYGQFYPPTLFCRYNMFNHHFFEGEPSRDVCREFLHRNHGDDVVVVTDPPFGGRVEILVEVLKKIMELWKEGADGPDSPAELPVMWIFPYFLEHRIFEGLPSFVMLDYKVEYENHPLFQSSKKACKKGSPVRIFTNIIPSKIVLPASDGYRFCEECSRYVSPENVHCKDCKSCTSKDGSTYTHCKLCNRCVKPVTVHCLDSLLTARNQPNLEKRVLPLCFEINGASLSVTARVQVRYQWKAVYVHCQSCQQCALPDHQCDRQKDKVGCHICGSLDHKRRDCPEQFNKVFRHKKRRKDSS
ncbi:rRNA N6-adenosine-methyltransferase ZCCHC4-like isoform X2 [Patiria miniata]|uniref:CCHC-type domain-containing protein n=1 Tax=Patiria miniata TaxID=46514 RepID=A0A914BAT5_PATMI|nr:rRNA N6-adenosine-methyltransferase ZCCHC4-like isoform X2 [Patiria miniata]